jgi:hypothetical protein
VPKESTAPLDACAAVDERIVGAASDVVLRIGRVVGASLCTGAAAGRRAADLPPAVAVPHPDATTAAATTVGRTTLRARLRCAVM